MTISTFESGLWFLLAFILNIKVFQHPVCYRVYFLLAISLAFLRSLQTLNQLSWPESANYVLGIATVGFMLLAPFTLFQNHPLLSDQGDGRPSLLLGYKVANNPRSLPTILRVEKAISRKQRYKSLVQFALKRLAQIAILCIIETWVFDRLLSFVLGQSTPQDFLLASAFPQESLYIWRQSLRQLAIRSFVSVYWIWSTFLFVRVAHGSLSILFVAILQIDSPDEWPPVFGSISEAYTVRRFWGKFWHQLLTKTLKSWAHLLGGQILGLPTNSRYYSIVLSFLVFLMSGLAHVVVGWYTGEPALIRDLLFYIANFLVISLEIFVAKGFEHFRKNTSDKGVQNRSKRCFGYFWVFFFFFMVQPYVEYPKIHHYLMN